MNIHEFQAKTILAKYGVAVPAGQVASSAAEAVRAAEALGGKIWAVKAQIHAGGRGKAGGIKLARSLEEVASAAGALIGHSLATHQTGGRGRPVRMVYVEQGVDIARELYVSLLLDRKTSRVTILASSSGGMDIEEVAAQSPEKIVRIAIDPAIGFMPYQGRLLAYALGLDAKQISPAVKLFGQLYRAFTESDASVVEINPLIVTGSGDLVALDAKMNFDDNALYRQKEIAQMRDEAEEDPAEVAAAKHGLSYIKLDGEIGCMVNGAGLAMATMDIITLYGSRPANFLDVGGGATKERVTEAFKILVGDGDVRGILVNIFGGIMRCDVIAEGIVAAAREVKLTVPLVVRLEGTNVDIGKRILAQSGLPIVSADNLDDAAKKAVAAIRKAA